VDRALELGVATDERVELPERGALGEVRRERRAARSVRFVENAEIGSSTSSSSSSSSERARRRRPPGLRFSSGAGSLETPCETYWRMSSRETPCALSMPTALESGSWNMAASRSPASTSSFSALSAWAIAAWRTRWKASVWRVSTGLVSGSF
jgi:hypothetical protein